MSNTTNEQTLEQIFDEVLEHDSQGLLEDEIDEIANAKKTVFTRA